MLTPFLLFRYLLAIGSGLFCNALLFVCAWALFTCAKGFAVYVDTWAKKQKVVTATQEEAVRV